MGETPHRFTWDDVPEAVIYETIKRQEFHTDSITLTRLRCAPGSVFPSHSHPQSQVTVVLSGMFTFDYGDRVEHYRAGEILFIPGGIPHQGRAEHGAAEILTIVSPPRGEQTTVGPGNHPRPGRTP